MTIVVATYNRPAYLDVMVSSVLASAAKVTNPVRPSRDQSHAPPI